MKPIGMKFDRKDYTPKPYVHFKSISVNGEDFTYWTDFICFSGTVAKRESTGETRYISNSNRLGRESTIRKNIIQAFNLQREVG